MADRVGGGIMGPGDIKRLRDFLGWSQEKLARELGVSFSTVNRWERGRSRPSPLAEISLWKLEAGCSYGKRAHQRFSSALPLELRSTGGTGSFRSVTENISCGGLMFSTEKRLGSGLSITVGIKPAVSSALLIDAEVAWVGEAGGTRKVGVRFSPGMETEIADLISGLSSGNGAH